MANETVYPFGTGGSLPGSVGIINDRTTGGADKAWSAEQGKLACVDIDKNTQDIFEMNSESVILTWLSVKTGWYINSTNNWTQNAANPSNYAYYLIPITPGERYRVYGDTHIALLKSATRSSGSSPDYCSGYTGRIVIDSGKYYDFIAPADAVYLYFVSKFAGTDKTGYVRTSYASYVGSISGLADDMVRVNSKRIDTSTRNRNTGWYINDSGNWVRNTATPSNYVYINIPITPGEKYILFAGTTSGLFAILHSTSRTSGSAADYATGYSNRMRVPSGRYYSFTAPEDANYVYVVLVTGGSTMDAWVSEAKSISDQVAEFGSSEDSKLDEFEAAPERFAWLKISQMVNIKWTPKKGTIQKARSTSKYAANTEQSGMIYSSVAEYDKRVGSDVSLHTFMTALNNPYSLIYTECVRGDYSQSAYGITYYGAVNSGSYYGMVCSGLANYALGLSLPYTAEDYEDDLVNAGINEVVYDQSANGAKRGDVLWSDGHIRMVKDVWRKDGIVTNVLISEELEPQAKDNAIRTASEFNSYLSTNSVKIIRYKELYKNINYTPSPYVAVGDETPETITYNDDICTFAGDKAAFAEGDLIYIHCRNLDYPQMELYKGETLVDTITLASDSRAALTEDNLCYAVNLSNDNLAYGKYKARLKNSDSYSDYTYFEIINATVTMDEYNVATYSSANAVAVCYYWQRYHDNQGAKIYDTRPLPGNASGTFSTTPPGSTWPLLKVLFQGEYGRVAAKHLVE